MTEESVHLTPQDLATRFRLSVRTIERWRADRYGPSWIIIGGSIRYRMSDVLAWEFAQIDRSCAGAHQIVTSTTK